MPLSEHNGAPSPFTALVGWLICFLLAFAIAPQWARAAGRESRQNDLPLAPAPQARSNPLLSITNDNLTDLMPLEDEIEHGQWQEAVPGLTSYLQAYPTSARAHYDLGYVFFRTHQIGGAVKELSKSLELNQNNAQAHKILGLVCTFVGRYDLAETELRAAAGLEPNSAEIHYWLGRVYYTRDVYPLALKEFKTAVQLKPSYMQAYTNLGLVEETLGKNDEALNDYGIAVKMDQAQHRKSPWPFEHLSAHYDRMRQPDRAIEFAGQALAIDPQCDVAYYDLAKAYQMQSEWQQSADAAQKAISIHSTTPEYYYILSVALRKLGKTSESDAALKQFQQIHKNQNHDEELWQEANGESQYLKPPSSPSNEH